MGTIFVWEKWLPQSHRGQAPALTRQGGNVRVAAPYHVEFLFQNEYASYTGRSGRTSLCSRRSAGRGFFQLQNQTCQKLWPLSALEFEARLLLPSSSSKIKMSRTGAVPKVMSVALIELVEMTATLNVVVSINSTTVMQTYWTAPT